MTTTGPSIDALAERESGLKRGLTAGQLSMIAIGGAIGTGLFLGSGFAIGLAGPSVLISYAIGGVIALLLMGALAEMTAAHPGAGSFGVQAERYLGPFAGFLIRYAYLSGIILAIGTEVTAVAIYMKVWLPQVPGLVWIIGFSAALIAVNAFSVSLFGSVEYAFSLIKIVAIVGFILLGALWVFGPSAAQTGAGFHLYLDHGGLFPNGPWGTWVAVIVAIFSYFSIEMIAVAAAEAADPQRAVVRAFKATLIRLAVFYMATLALMLAIVPWTVAGAGKSPFVTVIDALQIVGAADVMNFVILIAALSAMNSQLYTATRMLFGLSRAGFAPSIFGQLDSRGVPVKALGIAALGVAIAALVYTLSPTTAFTVMISIATCGAMVTWLMIFLTHLAFRRHNKGPTGPFRMWGAPWTSLLGACLMGAILLTTAFTEAFRLTLVIGVPFLLFLSGAYYLRSLSGPRKAA
ncbi:amino acid permease [Caulobacter sp. ErkDOM-YI]|uniref:amino acid permease n=1 Tax=unclassified Caulobacter TaxID=2648921 RepID=UPI003AF56EC0